MTAPANNALMQVPPLPPELSPPLRTNRRSLMERGYEARPKLEEVSFFLDCLRAELKGAGDPLALRAYIAAALAAYRSVLYRVEHVVKGVAELQGWYRNEQEQRGFPWKEPDKDCKKGKWHDGDPIPTALKMQRDTDVHVESTELNAAVTYGSWVGDTEPLRLINRTVFIVVEKRGRFEAAHALASAISALQRFVTAYEKRIEAYVAAQAALAPPNQTAAGIP